MRQIIIFFLALSLAISSFAPNTGTKVPTVNNELYEKRKKQKTAAWILLGGGAALTIGGVVVGTLEANLLREDEGSTFGTIMVFTGLAAIAGSISLFIASAKNKRNVVVASVSFEIEKTTIIKSSMAYASRYPL